MCTKQGVAMVLAFILATLVVNGVLEWALAGMASALVVLALVTVRFMPRVHRP